MMQQVQEAWTFEAYQQTLSTPQTKEQEGEWAKERRIE